MKTQIKKATLKDAREISNLIRETIKKVNDKGFTKKQLKAWYDHNSVKTIRKNIQEKNVFIALEKEKIIGTINFQKGSIAGMFVKYNKLGKGIGKKLLAYIEKFAKKEGIKKLELKSSPFAYEFYKNQGFKPSKKVKVSCAGCLSEKGMVKKLK